MSELRDGDQKVILFTSAPRIQNLCCILTYISDEEKRDVSVKSDYHWQILKCRQLIFTTSEVLASPVMRNLKCICIITSRDFYNSGKLKQYLDKLKLKGQTIYSLSNTMYETCLRYTFLAHLAPLWNHIGSILVQGRNFLESTTQMNAMKMDISFKDNQMHLMLWPCRIKLSKVSLNDMGIPTVLTQDFESSQKNTTLNLSRDCQWLHVLPSLKEGKVVTISRQIPESCPFKSYKELRRHWKNVYGYRLPESETDITYYSLFFPPFPTTIYTYPNLCVRPFRPVILQCLNVKDAVEQFILDLTKKVPKICGQEFKVEMKLRYPTYEILPSNMNADRPNLSHIPIGTPRLSTPHQALLSSTLVKAETPGTSSSNSLYSQSMNKSQNLSLMTPTFNSHKTDTSSPDSKNLFGPPSSAFFTTYSELQRNSEMKMREENGFHFLSDFSSPGIRSESTQPVSLVMNNREDIQPIIPVFGKKNITQAMTPLTPIFTKKSNDTIKENLTRNLQSNKKMIMKKLSQPTDEKKICTIVKEFQLKTGYVSHSNPEEILCIKKPRIRPPVQDDVDVEAYARIGDMTKVNTTTLVKWLRERNVACRVKDKKSELVNRVMAYLNLPSSS